LRQPHDISQVLHSQLGRRVYPLDRLSSAGITMIVAVEYFNPAHDTGGQFLVATNKKKLLVTDFFGNVLREIIYYDDLGILGSINDLALITSGPDAGAFAAAVDKGNNAGSEIIVFKLRN
jgi:hypothetical protein